MEINSLRCNHCSANLEINPKIKFFNCTYCGSSLTIKRNGNVLYTEVLDEIKGNTDLLIDQSDKLLKEQEIERLDREWLLERERFKIHSQDGESRYPEGSYFGVQLIGGVISIGVFIYIFRMFSNLKIPQAFIYLFIIIMVGGIILMILNGFKSVQYNQAKGKYLAKRKVLLGQLEE